MKRARKLRLEQLERRQLLVAEFHMLALIYPETELGGVRISMTPELVAAHQKAIQIDLPQAIAQLAGDQLTARVHVEIVDRVLDDLFLQDGRYEYAVESSISDELDRYTKSGWYDHIYVIHGFNDPTIGPTALWGGGLARYGMSIASMNYGNLATDLAYFDFTAAAIHEWMHGLESQYFFARGVPRGLDPEGGVIDIHDALPFGYTREGEGRAAFLTFYRDFLKAELHNYHTDGSNSGLGLGPNAWDLGVPREDVTVEPGSPLTRPDVSPTELSLLSEVYFASQSTSAGTIKRIHPSDSVPVSIGGVQFNHGVELNAQGEIVVNLLGRASQFESTVGISDEVTGNTGSVVFQIFGDDRLIWTSDVLTPQDTAVPISVDVEGVNQLKLVVLDAGTASIDDKAVWADARFRPFHGDFVSDKRWVRSNNEFGTIGLDRTTDWKPIRIEDKSYGKGIGVHADSEIVVDLDRLYDRFQAEVGISEDIQFDANAKFEVFLDDRLAYSSGLKNIDDPASPIDIDVRSVQQMRLLVTNPHDSFDPDSAVWAAARLVKVLPSDATDLLLIVDNEGFQIVDQSSGNRLRRGTADSFSQTIVTGNHAESVELNLMPATNVPLRLDTAGGDDEIHLRSLGFSSIDGGSGTDALYVGGEISTIDLVTNSFELHNFERIVLDPNSPQQLTLTPAALKQIAGNDPVFTLRASKDDTISLGTGWQIESAAKTDGVLWHRLISGQIALRLANERPWTNPIRRHDVTGDGLTSALDAFRIINLLGRATSVPIPVSQFATTPPDYVDVNGDQMVSAGDALIVINELERQRFSTSNEVIAEREVSPLFLPDNRAFDASRFAAKQLAIADVQLEGIAKSTKNGRQDVYDESTWSTTTALSHDSFFSVLDGERDETELPARSDEFNFSDAENLVLLQCRVENGSS